MSFNPIFALAPFIILTVTAITVMLAIAVRRNFVFSNCIAAGGLLLSLISIAWTWQDSPIQATQLLRVDKYALFVIALLLLAGLSVLGFCHDYFKTHEGDNEELPLLLLTSLLGAAVLAASSHFATFFLGLETLSISLFTLIGYPANQAHPLEAAIKYLVLSGTSSAFLLMGMALFYAQSGELGFSGIGRFIAGQPALNPVILGSVILIVAGLGFKLSAAPFHMWTPDVYEGSPAPITALIATVSKGAVFVLLLRLFISIGSDVYAPLQTVLSLVAALSIVGGNLLALLQTNIKRLLAYSSIAHMGYLLVAFIAGASIARSMMVESVTFYLVAYFITTIGAFGIVSILSSPQQEAGDISILRGLYWRCPWLAGALTLMLLSLAGLPLTAGFIGKFYIFTSGADGRLWGLLAAVIAGSGLAFYYYLRIVAVMSMTLELPLVECEKPFSGWISTATLAVLSVLVVWFGIFPGNLIHVIQSLADTVR